MPFADPYPAGYRAEIAAAVDVAVRAGESVSVVGLSGAGKSNLLAFLAQRERAADRPLFVLVDGNRLAEHTPAGFLQLMRRALERAWPLPPEPESEPADPLDALDASLARRFSQPGGSPGLCLLLDLSLLLDRAGVMFGPPDRLFFNSLRALRDAHKFRLTYVAGTRHPLPPGTELSELFHAHSCWLGPLNEADARWTVARFAARAGLSWDAATQAALLEASGRYPSLLRAMCEAHAAGAPAQVAALAGHPAVRARLAEFWADPPTEAELRSAGLISVAVLMAARPPTFDAAVLTAKEHQLLQYFQSNVGRVCTKDDLIRAVWPEDKLQTGGVRDDSLAQLVRRLREKIETDPSRPRFVHTVPGRGYRFSPGAAESSA